MPTWRWYLQRRRRLRGSRVTTAAGRRSCTTRGCANWSSATDSRWCSPCTRTTSSSGHCSLRVPVRLIDPGEVEVQHLLKESALLITDYSSVGWDFRLPAQAGDLLPVRPSSVGCAAHRSGRRVARPRASHARRALRRAWTGWRRPASRWPTNTVHGLTGSSTNATDPAANGSSSTRVRYAATASVLKRIRSHEVTFLLWQAHPAAQALHADHEVVLPARQAAADRQEPRAVRGRDGQAVRRQPALHLRRACPPRRHSEPRCGPTPGHLPVADAAHAGRQASLAGLLLLPRPRRVLGQQPELPLLRHPASRRGVPADLARHAAQADAARPRAGSRARRRLSRAGVDHGQAMVDAAVAEPVRDRGNAQRLPVRR